MRKFLLFLFAPVFIFLVGIYWFKTASLPPAVEGEAEDFLISKGLSASQIGDKLEKEGLIKSSLAFKLYVQITGRAGQIQAGEYRLSPNYSLFKIVEELVRGPVGVWVTIPEGYRREEIAWKFADSLRKEDKENFVEEFLQASTGQEGYLFPDTYVFLKNAPASAIIQKMQATFARKVGTEITQEQLIVASLVERETKTAKERPVVAGIIYKRLKAGWPLQIDATLQYAVSSIKSQVSGIKKIDWWPVLTKEDMTIKSPYNTYKYPGLPPTPIANPGLSSIRAAIYPQESDFWFYLHDTNDLIHYAKTSEEHKQNIEEYLKNNP